MELVPTALAAKKNRRDVSGFEMNEQQTADLKCPAGHEPQHCCYKQSNDEFKLSFDRNTCASCPHKEECHAKIFKKAAQVLVTKKSLTRISLEEKMSGGSIIWRNCRWESSGESSSLEAKSLR